MFVIRHKVPTLTYHYQNGILAALANNNFNINGIKRRNFTLHPVRNLKIDNCKRQELKLESSGYVANGIIESPLGACPPIPNTNLVDYVFKDVGKWVDNQALTCASTGRTYSYGMLRTLITRCAKALLGHVGLKPRDVIGLLLPNIPEFIIVSHGAIQAGLTVTFVNPLYTPDEIKRQFQNAGVKMIVTVPILMEVALTVAPHLQDYNSTLCIGGEDDTSKNVHGLESLLRADHECEIPGINPKELCLLPYSSGTTGLPKGVMLSHYNLVANLVQGDHPLFMDKVAKDGKAHRVFTALPLFHIYGFNGILNIVIRDGGQLITIPRFTPEDYVKALITYRPTFLFVVPSLLLFLASHPAVKSEHLSSIEGIQSGAAPLTEGLLQKFREKLGRSDVLIRQGYGMTESSPVTFIMPKNTPPSKKGTIGIVYRDTLAKVICLNTGETLGPHQSGELLVKGPQVMMGYLNNEKATAETIDEEGWLHTGDVGYYDEDGYFYIVDRCKELIKVKGNQVSPTELENIILEIEGVNDVAVVGIPDTLAGEIPRAYVVKRADKNISEEEIQRIVNSKVTNYKKLAGGVKFIDAIPRNPSGKVLRHELKIQK